MSDSIRTVCTSHQCPDRASCYWHQSNCTFAQVKAANDAGDAQDFWLATACPVGPRSLPLLAMGGWE